MAAGMPTLGIRAVFDDTAARQRIKHHQAQLRVLERIHIELAHTVANAQTMMTTAVVQGEKTRQAIRTQMYQQVAATRTASQVQIRAQEDASRRLAQVVAHTEKRKGEAVGRGSKSQMASLRQLRWRMITIIFFYRLLSKVVRAAFRTMTEEAETAAARGGVRALARSYEVDLGRLARALTAASGGALSARDAIAAAQSGLLIDQGEFVQQYTRLWEAARVAAVTSGADQQEVFESLVRSLVEGSGEAIDASTNIFQVRLALQKYAEAANTTVDALEHQEAAQVILNTVLGRTEELLEGGVAAVLEQAGEIDRLAASWQNLKDTTGVAIGALVEAAVGFENLSDFVQESAEFMVTFGASVAGAIVYLREFAKAIGPGQTAMGAYEEGIRTVEEVLRRGREALNQFNDEVEEGTYVYERYLKPEKIKIDPLIDHLLKREELMQRHAERIAQIELRRTQRLEEIEIKHDRVVAQIERRIQRERDRSWRNYNRKVTNQTIEHLMTLRQDLERHLQDMLQKEQRYRIRSIQDMRLYNYERSILVAEGDVLAIEDLDARYELEQLARSENFHQQQVESQEDFELRRQQKREDFEEELRQLAQALEDQLLEINIRRREQLDEAELQRQEDMRRAQRDYEQSLEQENLRHEQSLKQWNQYWAKLSEQTKVGVEDIRRIISEYFGPGGLTDQIISDFMERSAARLNIRSIIEGIVGALERTPPTEIRRYSQFPGDRPRDYARWSGRQYGGESVVSRPTLIPVGEGYQPERISIQPVSPIGGSVSLNWSGGVIPVHGTGNLSGMDLSTVGDAIAQGIVIAQSKELLRRRG